MPSARSGNRFSASPTLVLLALFLTFLWLAGGASRPDAAGQVVVRGAAWGALVAMTLLGDRSLFRTARPLWFLLGAAILLALAQLILLPPALWTVLPGRTPFLEAAAASGQAQPWRPWAIVPGAAVNAASSLAVPLATLVLVTGLRPAERTWLPVMLLACTGASAVLGLLQFAGSALNNPLINDTTGQVSANFANRNHFALFMALGCLTVPAWVFLDGRRPGWRGPAGVGLIVLFLLTILASGSRAGLGAGLAALVLGLLLSWRDLRRSLSHFPRWVFPAAVAVIAAMVVLTVLLSLATARAASIGRLLAQGQEQDRRRRGLPVVLEMVRTYFPFGGGLGGFDPLFRMHEPFALLKPTYFNHAHNDFLEIVLGAGVPGLLLLVAGLGWWVWASLRAWRASADRRSWLPRLGSAVLLLLVIASAFDYPARTPMFMAVAVIAGFWLSGAALASPDRGRSRSPLPPERQHL